MFCNNKLIHFVISISIMFAPMMVVAKVDAYTTHHHICTFDSPENDSDIGTHCDNCYFYFSENHDFIEPGNVSNTYLILSDIIHITHYELTGRDKSELATRDPPLL